MTDLLKSFKVNAFTAVPTFSGLLQKNAKLVALLSDWERENPYAILTVPFNPDNGDIQQISTIEDSGGTPLNVRGIATTTGSIPTSINAITSAYWNQRLTAYDVQEEASGIVRATSTGAASSTLIAGVATKKFKIFAMSLVATGTAATAAATINEATSGTVLLGCETGTGSNTATLYCGPNGVLQPTVNNTLQLTTVANQTADATLIIGDAR